MQDISVELTRVLAENWRSECAKLAKELAAAEQGLVGAEGELTSLEDRRRELDGLIAIASRTVAARRSAVATARDLLERFQGLAQPARTMNGRSPEVAGALETRTMSVNGSKTRLLVEVLNESGSLGVTGRTATDRCIARGAHTTVNSVSSRLHQLAEAGVADVVPGSSPRRYRLVSHGSSGQSEPVEQIPAQARLGPGAQVSIEARIIGLFSESPGAAHRAAEIIAALQRQDPSIREKTVSSALSKLVRKGVLLRNSGVHSLTQ